MYYIILFTFPFIFMMDYVHVLFVILLHSSMVSEVKTLIGTLVSTTILKESDTR